MWLVWKDKGVHLEGDEIIEVQQGPTPRVRFRGVHFNAVSIKRELTMGLCTFFVHNLWMRGHLHGGGGALIP